MSSKRFAANVLLAGVAILHLTPAKAEATVLLRHASPDRAVRTPIPQERLLMLETLGPGLAASPDAYVGITRGERLVELRSEYYNVLKRRFPDIRRVSTLASGNLPERFVILTWGATMQTARSARAGYGRLSSGGSFSAQSYEATWNGKRWKVRPGIRGCGGWLHLKVGTRTIRPTAVKH